MKYDISDINLAKKGMTRIEWAKKICLYFQVLRETLKKKTFERYKYRRMSACNSRNS